MCQKSCFMHMMGRICHSCDWNLFAHEMLGSVEESVRLRVRGGVGLLFEIKTNLRSRCTVAICVWVCFCSSVPQICLNWF